MFYALFALGESDSVSFPHLLCFGRAALAACRTVRKGSVSEPLLVAGGSMQQSSGSVWPHWSDPAMQHLLMVHILMHF